MSNPDTRLRRIREAYASAASGMPDYYDALPAWETLPGTVREAIIVVYAAGCVDGGLEEMARRQEAVRRETMTG